MRLSVLGAAPVVGIGGISSDEAGFGIGPMLDPGDVRRRIQAAFDGGQAPSPAGQEIRA